MKNVYMLSEVVHYYGPEVVRTRLRLGSKKELDKIASEFNDAPGPIYLRNNETCRYFTVTRTKQPERVQEEINENLKWAGPDCIIAKIARMGE